MGQMSCGGLCIWRILEGIFFLFTIFERVSWGGTMCTYCCAVCCVEKQRVHSSGLLAYGSIFLLPYGVFICVGSSVLKLSDQTVGYLPNCLALMTLGRERYLFEFSFLRLLS